MEDETKNPAQCSNTATGQPNRLDKQSTIKRQNDWPEVKHSLGFRDANGKLRTVTDNTRLADVLVKLTTAGSKGITALDFPQGVRLGGLVFVLRRMGLAVSTERVRVPGDPFRASIARYVLTSGAVEPSGN